MRFNIDEEIKDAWDYLWADNVKGRKKDWKGETYYLTATDLEDRVRCSIAEKLEGKRRGFYGRHHGTYMCPKLNGIGRLLDRCRNWLSRQVSSGVLQVHNFGRGHCSGARFRPVGEPLSPQEQRSIKKKETDKTKVKPIHFKDPQHKGYSYDAPALCTRKARKTNAKKGRFCCRSRRRSTVRTTKNGGEVTCKRCLKLMAEDQAPAPIS